MLACSSSAGSSEIAPPLARATEALRRGGVVVYPTETFYGLGVDATNERAIERLLRLKGREPGQPISVLVRDRAMLTTLVRELSRDAIRLMEGFWPGPLTLVLPARKSVAASLTGGTGTIGVRCSSHSTAAGLVAGLGRPVTTPSANPAGAEPPVTVRQARAYFGDGVEYYVDGGTLPGGKGSTIVRLDADGLRVIREGVIPSADVEAALNRRAPHA